MYGINIAVFVLGFKGQIVLALRAVTVERVKAQVGMLFKAYPLTIQVAAEGFYRCHSVFYLKVICLALLRLAPSF